MSMLHLLRRLHLYLGMFLLPWTIVFGVSSLVFNHASLQRPVTWSPVTTVPYPTTGGPDADLREVGRRVLTAAGLDGGFYANRAATGRITVTRPSFLNFQRAILDPGTGMITVERRQAQWPQYLGAMHTRAGYDLESPGNTVWAVMVDLFCVGLIVWILTGLIMWWQLPGTRRWGLVALLSGLTSCVALVLLL